MNPLPPPLDDRIEALRASLAEHGYVADPALASVLLLMDLLGRPALLEGEAGVGKTEIAATLARLHGCPLIRLQCYEGLDTTAAVYEWNYPHQLLAIKLHAEAGDGVTQTDSEIFSERFLIKRPLLQAISAPVAPVLLIDEIDRADEAFEAFLLEVLADYQITVPELGTLRATTRPRVILTSNGTRELSDALRRRCLYHWVDFPDVEKEAAIIARRLPGVQPRLARQAVAFVQRLRTLELRKTPGIA